MMIQLVGQHYANKQWGLTQETGNSDRWDLTHTWSISFNEMLYSSVVQQYGGMESLATSSVIINSTLSGITARLQFAKTVSQCNAFFIALGR